MTCIAGVVDKTGKVWMACDSLLADDDDNRTISRDSKMSKKGGVLIGTAGSWRLANVIHHIFVPPARKARVSDMAYLAGPFVTALERALRERAPRVEEEAGRKNGLDLQMLVGFRGGLYFVDGAFDVSRSADDFEACGSGAQVARGALFATPKLAPRTRLLRALAAAERHKMSVQRPFKVMSL